MTQPLIRYVFPTTTGMDRVMAARLDVPAGPSMLTDCFPDLNIPESTSNMGEPVGSHCLQFAGLIPPDQLAPAFVASKPLFTSKPSCT